MWSWLQIIYRIWSGKHFFVFDCQGSSKISLEGMRQTTKTLCLIDGFWVENPFRRSPMVNVCVCVCVSAPTLHSTTFISSLHAAGQYHFIRSCSLPISTISCRNHICLKAYLLISCNKFLMYQYLIDFLLLSYNTTVNILASAVSQYQGQWGMQSSK
jgi:hypothetical protein